MARTQALAKIEIVREARSGAGQNRFQARATGRTRSDVRTTHLAGNDVLAILGKFASGDWLL